MARTKLLTSNVATEFYDKSPEIVEMSIAEEAVQHIMDRLIDLYQNPLVAAIRETISNAIDTTIQVKEMGLPVKPVKIGIDIFNSAFKVEDFGTGMSKENIYNIYSKYGSSTKKIDLNTVGAYGLGAKPPLAYTDSFIITTIKDKIKVVGVVTKTGKIPKIQIVSEMEVNEPNGTTISFNLKNQSDIEDAIKLIKDYYYFQNSISVPVEFFGIDNNTDEEPLEVLENYNIPIVIDNETFYLDIFTDLDYSQQIEVALGQKYNIHFLLEGYSYSTAINNNYSYSNRPNIYIKLSPGMVQFDSSRDGIKENNQYKSILKQITNYINNIKFPFRDITDCLSYSYIITKLIGELENEDKEDYFNNLTFNGLSFSELFNQTKDYNVLWTNMKNSQRNYLQSSPLITPLLLHNNLTIIKNGLSEKYTKEIKSLSNILPLPILFVPEEMELNKLSNIFKDKQIKIIDSSEVSGLVKSYKNKKEKLNNSLKVKKVIFNGTDDYEELVVEEEYSAEKLANYSFPIFISSLSLSYDYSTFFKKIINYIGNKENKPKEILIIQFKENLNLYKILDQVIKEDENNIGNIYYYNSDYYNSKSKFKTVMKRLEILEAKEAKTHDYLSNGLTKQMFLKYLEENKNLFEFNGTSLLDPRFSLLKYSNYEEKRRILNEIDSDDFKLAEKLQNYHKLKYKLTNPINNLKNDIDQEDYELLVKTYNKILASHTKKLNDSLFQKYESLPGTN